MSETFDPHHRWLGIASKDQPPNHYRLLAIDAFESDREVIAAAAELRSAHVRTYQLGKHSQASQELLNEIAAARVVLLDPEKKAQYDEELRQKTPAADSPPTPIVPPPVVGNDGLASQAPAPPQRHRLRVPYRTRRLWLLIAVGGGAVALVVFLAFVMWGPDEENIARDNQPSPSAVTSSPDAATTLADAPDETPRITAADKQTPGSRVPDAGDPPDDQGSLPPGPRSADAANSEAGESKHPDDDVRNPQSPLVQGAAAGDDTTTSSQQSAIVSVGTGADGPVVISDEYEVDSARTALTKSAATGASSVSVGSPGDFHAGDEVLIIAMRGVDAGDYEFHRIASVGANSIELASALVNSYDVNDSVAIQRVPNFTDVTVEPSGELTASAWNSWTGGIVAFRAKGVVDVKTGGSIHADSLGFRGGWAAATGGHLNGRQGQSCLGLGAQGSRDANGGGGGAGNYASRGGRSFADWGCGGGGGGYGSAGANGTGTSGFGMGGETCGSADLSRLMLGSGGGSGASDDDGGGSSSGGEGGTGGGIVFVAAHSLVLSGSLSANGANGQNAVNKRGEDESGGGGGGSGGSVYLVLATSASPADVSVSVRGGTGGTGWCRGGNGGKGVFLIHQGEIETPERR